jgi:hypothetical protein
MMQAVVMTLEVVLDDVEIESGYILDHLLVLFVPETP